MTGVVILGAVAEGVNAELVKLRAEETSPGLAELATSLAQAVDESEAPTSRAVVARELRAVMADLRKLAPVGEEGDAVDELTQRRTKRLARDTG